MKIDSHVHFWKYDPQTYSWIPDDMARIRKDFLPEDIEQLLKKNYFDGCIAVQADQSEEETVKLLEIANTFDLVKGVVGWVDLSAENAKNRLELYSRDPFFKGVRHTVWDEQGEFMTASDFQNGIAALHDFGLIYEILAFDYQLAAAVELAKKFPEQKFVLDHMGKPRVSDDVSAEWKENILKLGELPNVFCKISGLFTQPEKFNWKTVDFPLFLEVVQQAFGEDRLMFGSDWPVSTAAVSYEETVEQIRSYFPEASLQKILGENAAAFYNL
ncbi:MAG: amidohydrolase family protein [Salinimicrobium sp.]